MIYEIYLARAMECFGKEQFNKGDEWRVRYAGRQSCGLDASAGTVQTGGTARGRERSWTGCRSTGIAVDNVKLKFGG